MKNKIKYIVAGILISPILFILISDYQSLSNAATLTKGYTFATNELVTAAKLHSLVDSATISAIDTADIADSAITTLKLGANSVNSSKIIDGTIETGDLLTRTLVSANHATNSITGIELSTNLTHGAGLYVFTNNTTVTFTNSTVNFQSSTLNFGANQIASSAVSGLNTNLSSVLSTNLITVTGDGSADTWKSILTLTTTATSGTVRVTGTLMTAAIAGGQQYIWLRDSTSNVNSFVGLDISSTEGPFSVNLNDTLSGATKTYSMLIASSAGSQVYTNTLSAPYRTNGINMTVHQFP